MRPLRALLGLLAVAAGVFMALNWSEIRMSYGPRCVGIQGTAASMEARSWFADAACNDIESMTPLAYGFKGDLTTPVVCQFDIQSVRFTVHDEGQL